MRIALARQSHTASPLDMYWYNQRGQMIRQTHEALILKPIVPGSVADAVYNATW